MTQAQWDHIQNLQTLDSVYYEEIKQLQQQIAQIEQARSRMKIELNAICDHTRPDGTSSVRGGYLANTCDICDWNDY